MDYSNHSELQKVYAGLHKITLNYTVNTKPTLYCIPQNYPGLQVDLFGLLRITMNYSRLKLDYFSLFRITYDYSGLNKIMVDYHT